MTPSTPQPRPALAALALLALAATLACGPRTPAADPSFVQAEEAWRAQREARLNTDDGWLTLVGLYWLSPGENPFGSGDGNPVVLPAADGVAPASGVFVLGEDGSVTVRCAPGAGVTLHGEPVTEAVLRADTDEGGPDILHAGRILFYVIRRGDRVGIRVKDPESPARTQFRGLSWYPPDPEWVVTGTFVPFETPRTVEIASAAGTTETAEIPGAVRFTIGGRELELLPMSSDVSEGLFFVFADATSGPETYGAGRFLDVPPPDGEGHVELNFNRAYNPPCVFTPYATCPLPIPENVLPIPVRAGERMYTGHH